ncbi:hypothetical protein Nepgr_031509 [Nepenthes gracilis]|uniref:BZIP domain-containing protein n=1 Tax=Nepenthes gracilis TaxID=150966 RepID=A0AAD3TIA4_NEPGR|nr:hypothetical protein Nepgr_031509 [Nepenthes gracilis]
MASPGGTTSRSSSSDPEEVQLLADAERKRKRMESNRESARRSRLRKQKHLDDLTAQIAHLSRENNDLISRINLTTDHFLKMKAENSVLSAQMAELSSRFQSLNEIITALNFTNNSGVFGAHEINHSVNEFTAAAAADCFMINHPWSSLYLSQPIVASAADMLQY